MLYRFLNWILLACTACAGCAELPRTDPIDQSDSNDNLNSVDNDDPDGPSDNPADPGDDSLSMMVTLGSAREVTPTEQVEVDAEVSGAPAGTDLYFFWDIVAEDLEDESAIKAVRIFDGVKGLSRISFILEALYPGAQLVGARFNVRARVLALEAEGSSVDEASASVPLTVVAFQDPESDDNDNSNENSEDSSDEEDGTPKGDGEDSNGNGTPGGSGDEQEQPEEPVDPCAGISQFTLIEPDPMLVFLFEVPVTLEPTICQGTQPYTYSWTPTTDIQDPSGGISGGGAITSPSVDFVPTSAGSYSIQVTVSESGGSTEQMAFEITVENFSPLLALAGSDVAATQSDGVILSGNATGGSGDYEFAWNPPGTPLGGGKTRVDTSQSGSTTYSLTVTDEQTGLMATDSVVVTVVPEETPACATELDWDLGVNSAQFVAYYSGGGIVRHAVVASGSSVLILDLDSDTLLATLNLPADVTGLAIDDARNLGFACTQLAGGTRSVQVIDLATRTLDDNIALSASVSLARGLAVIPATGEVLVAVTGVSSGVFLVDPAAGSVSAAAQSVHYPGAFSQPIDVAYLGGSVDAAIVANAGSAFVTVVPLEAIDQTPDIGPALGSLETIEIDGTSRAIVGDPAHSRVVVGWNNGSNLGLIHVINFDDIETYGVLPSFALTAGLFDLGLSINDTGSEAYAATGTAGVAIINVDFATMVGTISGSFDSARSVTAQTGPGDGRILIVGSNSDLSERCP